MTQHNPFQRSANRRFDAALEFRIFQERAPKLIKGAISKRSRYDILAKVWSFYVDAPSKDTIQAWFGGRSMFRVDLEDKAAVECGASLHYSLGPTGEVAVSLYPCRSSLARTHEDQILIGIGFYTAHQLCKSVPSHVASLVAYSYISSLDAEATATEELRIIWLRNTRPLIIDGKFVIQRSRSAVFTSAQAASRAIAVGAVTALLKPIGLLLVVYLLLRLELSNYIQYIKGK